MCTKLIVCIFLWTSLSGGTPMPAVNSTSQLDSVVEMVSKKCFTVRDHELFSGDIVKNHMAKLVNFYLGDVAIQTIGLAEMRRALGYAPLGPWAQYRRPSEEEIEGATSVEEYYELKEPRDTERSLNWSELNEENVPPAIGFLDERYPEIRAIYRLNFGEIHSDVTREQVDRIIDKWWSITLKISKALPVRDVCKKTTKTKKEFRGEMESVI
uniref:Alpha,alpha-trehalase n=1 Tax=Caenorhabditis tropicalis TaxID=1561998 RepID=A0A1I7U6F0_9PELO